MCSRSTCSTCRTPSHPDPFLFHVTFNFAHPLRPIPYLTLLLKITHPIHHTPVPCTLLTTIAQTEGITWFGCGAHIPSVLDSIPEEEWCGCEPSVERGGRKYPPGGMFFFFGLLTWGFGVLVGFWSREGLFANEGLFGGNIGSLSGMVWGMFGFGGGKGKGEGRKEEL